VACRDRAPKRELLRIARSAAGELVVDHRQIAPGRGAYVHRRAACAEAALRKGLLVRALGARGDDGEAGRLQAGIEEALTKK
jgi:predicted RNA-binding protein YlxR (DUF448 family)